MKSRKTLTLNVARRGSPPKQRGQRTVYLGKDSGQFKPNSEKLNQRPSPVHKSVMIGIKHHAPIPSRTVKFSSELSVESAQNLEQVTFDAERLATALKSDLMVMSTNEYSSLMSRVKLKELTGKMMLKEHEVAILLHTTAGALRKKRSTHSKNMPLFVRNGRRILYDLEDVLSYIENNKSS
ncbi:hypothetical protein [Maritalea sp. S77]|uniref:hypothetical protein n=1 Tax=Maritalea sp. S77 TaxID=3415125 RepID=UPI003C7D5584